MAIENTPWMQIIKHSRDPQPFLKNSPKTQTTEPKQAIDSFIDVANYVTLGKEWAKEKIKESKSQNTLEGWASYFGALGVDCGTTVATGFFMELAIPLDLMCLAVYTPLYLTDWVLFRNKSVDDFFTQESMPFRDGLAVLLSIGSSLINMATDTGHSGEHLAEFLGWEKNNSVEDNMINVIAGFCTFGSAGLFGGLVAKPHITGLVKGIEIPKIKERLAQRMTDSAHWVDGLLADRPPLPDTPFSVGRDPVLGFSKRNLRPGKLYGDLPDLSTYPNRKQFLVTREGILVDAIDPRTPIPLDACFELYEGPSSRALGKVTPGGRVHDYGNIKDLDEAKAVAEARGYPAKPKNSPHQSRFDSNPTALKYSELVELERTLNEQISWYESHNAKRASEGLFGEKITELETKKDAVQAAHQAIKQKIDGACEALLTTFDQRKNEPGFDFQQQANGLKALQTEMTQQGITPPPEFTAQLTSAKNLSKAATQLQQISSFFDEHTNPPLKEIDWALGNHPNALNNIEQVYKENGVNVPQQIEQLKTKLSERRTVIITAVDEVNGHIDATKKIQTLDALKAHVDKCNGVLGDNRSKLPNDLHGDLVQRLDDEITLTLKEIIDDQMSSKDMTIGQLEGLKKQVDASTFATTHKETIETAFAKRRAELDTITRVEVVEIAELPPLRQVARGQTDFTPAPDPVPVPAPVPPPSAPPPRNERLLEITPRTSRAVAPHPAEVVTSPPPTTTRSASQPARPTTPAVNPTNADVPRPVDMSALRANLATLEQELTIAKTNESTQITAVNNAHSQLEDARNSTHGSRETKQNAIIQRKGTLDQATKDLQTARDRRTAIENQIRKAQETLDAENKK